MDFIASLTEFLFDMFGTVPFSQQEKEHLTSEVVHLSLLQTAKALIAQTPNLSSFDSLLLTKATPAEILEVLLLHFSKPTVENMVIAQLRTHLLQRIQSMQLTDHQKDMLRQFIEQSPLLESLDAIQDTFELLVN